MNIKQFVIMSIIICGYVLSAGYKNNKLQNNDITDDDNQQQTRQEIVYSIKGDTFKDWEQIGVYQINNGKSVEQDVRDGDTSYIYIFGFSWPELYDAEIVKSIEYTVFNTRAQFETDDVQIKEFLGEKIINTESRKISGEEQGKLNMILFMEFPTSTYSAYMNKQSPQTVLKTRNDILESALVEAKVLYNDGTESTDYYKMQMDTANSYILLR